MFKYKDVNPFFYRTKIESKMHSGYGSCGNYGSCGLIDSKWRCINHNLFLNKLSIVLC